MERNHAIKELKNLVGQDLRSLAGKHGITVVGNKGKINKGWAGQTVERYLGLPINSSRSPNLGTWELKVVPLIRNSLGRFVVKETMAITMIDPSEVRAKDFQDSHLFTKLRKIITVSREYIDPSELVSRVVGVHAFELEGTQLYDQISADYELVREHIRRDMELSGKMGEFVQPRTKGRGHGSTSRAFYARKALVEYLIGQKEAPQQINFEPANHQFNSSEFFPIAVGMNREVPFDLPETAEDCEVHAGVNNLQNRFKLDALMIGLPSNQSGKGRHKCPYCAFEAGFRAGMAATRTKRK